jgi:hypothetical protein
VKQRFARVDVADADDAPPIHQELFDRGSMRPGEGMQSLRIERTRKRLDAQVGEQRMRRERA